MAVPKFFEFFVPILAALNSCSPMKAKDLRAAMIDAFHLSKEDISEMLPSGKQLTYSNRINWATQYLKNAGLIATIARGTYTITDQGKKAYLNDADKINLHYLAQFDSFVKFQKNGNDASVAPPNVPVSVPSETDVTPFESIETAYNTIRTELSKSLLNAIMECSPEFFERLVIDLLISMGYGYDSKESGMVVGQTGDGGIDGIINEDKLGFSQVYVQAKRWDAGHTVGSPEVQAFAGALLGKGATKGLFITTTQFSKAAKKFVEDQKAMRVVLIDGGELTRLMIDYNVGVSAQQSFIIKQIDTDYFEE